MSVVDSFPRGEVIAKADHTEQILYSEIGKQLDRFCCTRSVYFSHYHVYFGCRSELFGANSIPDSSPNTEEE